MCLPHIRYFIVARFLLYLTDVPLWGTSVFPRFASLDPYIRRFVSTLVHSNHERFIDPRHIISHIVYFEYS